jgi:hypothetical protein
MLTAIPIASNAIPLATEELAAAPDEDYVWGAL